MNATRVRDSELERIKPTGEEVNSGTMSKRLVWNLKFEEMLFRGVVRGVEVTSPHLVLGRMSQSKVISRVVYCAILFLCV